MILPPRDAAISTADIDTIARDLASLDPIDVDRAVTVYVAAAIDGHRLDEAVRWQRVRLRARALRRRRLAE